MFNFFKNASAEGQLPLPPAESYDPGFFGWLTRNLPSADSGIGTEGIFGEGGLFGAGFLDMLNIGIGALAILLIVITGTKMIFARGNQDEMNRYRLQLVWIIIGLLVIGLAEIFAFDVLDPKQNLLEGNLSRNAVTDVVVRILKLLRYIMGGFVLIMTMISGYNLIVDGDNSSVQDQEKNFFQSFLFGVMMVLFAEGAALIISLSDLPVTAGQQDIANASQFWSEVLLRQIMSTVRFITSFLVSMAVLLVVWGALYYATSFGDESRQEQGKRIILGAIVAIIIVVSSFTLASFLLER